MNYFQDFDQEDNIEDNKNTKKNTFVYESFNDRLKKIKVRLSNNYTNDVSFLKIEKEENFTISDNESNFLTMLNREKVLNASPEFSQFVNEIKPFTSSFLILINNSHKLINIFSETLDKHLNVRANEDSESGEILNKINENPLNQRNYPFIISVLEVMTGFIKDIREDASEIFLKAILPNLVKLLCNSNNTIVIDKTFSVFVNIFKFLDQAITKNFRKFFLTLSELIFNKNKLIRKFSSESICFLFKNMDKAQLGKCLSSIFEIFVKPEIIFSLDESNKDKISTNSKNDGEDVVMQTNYDNFNELFENLKNAPFKSSSEFLKSLLIHRELLEDNSAEKVKLYLFLVDCVSDLLSEILIGMNKNLSVRADLLLENIIECFHDSQTDTEKENSQSDLLNREYLSFIRNIIVIDAIIKLFHILSQNNKKNAISLFHFFIYLVETRNEEMKISYPKLNLENLSIQLDKCITVDLSENTQMYCLIFIREMILKNYNRLNTQMIKYFIEFYDKITTNIINSEEKHGISVKNLFISEIFCLFVKFYSKELTSFYKLNNLDNTSNRSKILKIYSIIFTKFNQNKEHSRTVNSLALQNFFNNLKYLQKFEYVIDMIFLNNKRIFNINTNTHNEEYQINYMNYEEEILKILFELILNELKFENSTQILDTVTTFKFLCLNKNYKSEEEDNSKYQTRLNFHNPQNKLIVIQDLKYFEISENKGESSDLKNFIELYSKIVLFSLLNEEDFKEITEFSTKIFDYLIKSIKSKEEEQKTALLSQSPEEIKLFSVLLSEFNTEGVYFISKKEAALILLENFISINESFSNCESLNENFIKSFFEILHTDHHDNHYIGIVYKILNKILADNFQGNINEFIYKYNIINSQSDISSFLTNYSILLISHNNMYKAEYLNFIQQLYFSSRDESVNEIFEIMKNILELKVDQKNEKKFAFDIEVLISKFESFLPRNMKNTELSKNLILILFNFLLGGYWIRYTKTVWSVITKSMEKLITLVDSTGLNEIKGIINNTIQHVISFIKNIGTNDDFITRYGLNSRIIRDNYLTFNMSNNNVKGPIYMDNIIAFNFLLKQDELTNITLFYEGFLQSMQSYHPLFNGSNKLTRDGDLALNFLRFLIENLNFYCSEQYNWMDQILNKQENTATYSPQVDKYEYILCIFNNYVHDKEHKTGPLHRKLVEAMFMILSKINFSEISRNFLTTNNIRKILYQSIITSKSVKIQKFCLDILIMLDDRLKNYRKLLEAVVDNTNVIDRLYNIDKILNDNGLEMKREEREAIIPIIIRLYYSKYFYVSNENKKMRTKNKINLVSFFIQLNRKEFTEYTRIIFEPISVIFNPNDLKEIDFDSILFGLDLNELDSNIEKYFSSHNYNLKTFRKIIDILILNIKQITNLFHDSIYFVAILLKKILVFIKKLNSFIKSHLKSELKEFYEQFEDCLHTTNIDRTKYFNYYNNEGISQYLKFFTKNIKEIKKQIFGLLKNIFTKFYKEPLMIDKITNEICNEYKYVLDGIKNYNKESHGENFKLNSILNFFMSFAKNPHLHFIYINNDYMFCSILEIMKLKRIDNVTMKTLLDFVDFILSPYHNIKIQVAREEYIKTWKENIEKVKAEKEIDVDMNISPYQQENQMIDSNNLEEAENSVLIEELNLEENEENDDEVKIKNLDQLSEAEVKYNEENLIAKNFNVFNENLLFLVKNKKVKITVKDWNTRKLIEIFVYLWNMYQSAHSTEDSKVQSNSVELLGFLLRLLKNDNKIYKFKNKDSLCDILKVCHMLLLINKTDKNQYFKDFMTLIYKISEDDSNNRLVLSILLQEFYDYYNSDSETEPNKFKEILQLISNLNLSTKGVKAIAKKNLLLSLDKHEGYSNLDVDNTIDRMNVLDETFLSKFQLYHLEPLIYQLLVFSKHSDYSLQTISMSRIKLIFEIFQKTSKYKLEILLNKNEDLGMTIYNTAIANSDFISNKNSYESMLNAFYDLLEGGQKIKSNSNTSLARTILEILSHLNSIIFTGSNLEYTEKKFEIICSDLNFIKLKNYDYNFLEGILNLKYDIRCDSLQSLRGSLESNSLCYFSLIHVVVPVIKTFLTPNTFINSTSYTNEKQIENLINETIECIPGICKFLNLKDLKDFLFFFFNQIEKTNKKSSDDEKQARLEAIIIKMLYKGLTKFIETLTKIIKGKFEFDKEFLKYSNEFMEEFIENNKENFDKTGNTLKKKADDSNNNSLNYNKEYYKKLFEKMSSNFNSRDKNESHSFSNDITYLEQTIFNKAETYQSSDIIQFIKTKVYKTLKTIVIDSQKKEKNKQYYLRNYAIRPYLEVIKFLDPYQIKYELIQLNYEIINNLKNRDLTAREKAREAIKTVFDSLGCQIAPMIFDELKTQLHSGYQRYIMGYTCNYIINIVNTNYGEINARLVFDFSTGLILPILLEELFGEVAEEKEIEELVKKYKEAKQTKAFNSFYVLSSKIHLHNAIVDLIYPLRSYLLKRENDTATVNKANEVINHIIKGFKNNPTMNFDEILNFSYGLVINGLEINLKNSKEIKENKKLTIKGGEISDPKLKRKSYQQQINETYTIQIGAMNGKNYSMEISEKLIDNKNEIVLSNLFTSLGLDLFHISLKKKMFDFKSLNSQDSSEFSDRLSLLLSQVVICLKISNNNILSKSLKILTKLFDCKLFVIKKNLKKIVSSLFKNLNMINSQDMNIAQAILSSIGEILTKFKFYEISDHQLNILISFLKLNINSTQIKPYVFSCLLSLIKRRILHPSIYDMIKYIQEVYLTAFEENTITLCQNIIMEFLRSYPLEHAALLSHINYYVINLESPTRKCIINSLKILYKFFDLNENPHDNNTDNSSDIKSKVDAVVDFVLIKLLTLITNTDDADIKSLLYSNIDIIIEYLEIKDKTKIENYINKIIDWLQNGETERSMIKLSLNLLSVLISKPRTSVEKKADLFKDLIIERIASEYQEFEYDLEEKIENEQYESVNNNNKKNKEIQKIFENAEFEEESKKDQNYHIEDVTVLKVETVNWDIFYLTLVSLEKFVNNYPSYIKSTFKSSQSFQYLLIKCLKHPHMFIKSIANRLIASIFNELQNPKSFYNFISSPQSDDDSLHPVDFLLTNFRFLILNIDSSDKVIKQAISNCVFLIDKCSKVYSDVNNIFTKSCYEFLCRLYIESKSYLTNKEISRKIFNRIYDLFENLCTQLDENELKFYIDPILSLSYRIIDNKLAENELKSRVNKLLESLSQNLSSEFFAKKYKEIRDDINLLRRKRKMKMLENSIANPKEYLEKKKNKKKKGANKKNAKQ